MAPTMSSWIAVRVIGFTLILLLVSSAQAVNYEVHRHDVISTFRNASVILTSRDFLEQLNIVAPKASYTLQEATEHLLQFGALLRTRILDTFGSLLYVYYDDFNIAEVEALRTVYRAILERRYNVFNLVPNVLKNPDTRPSRICAEIHEHAAESCLRSSASVCRRIRKQHDLPHPDDRGTPALDVTYRMYRLSKISHQYPRGFSLTTMLTFLQREVLTITPNLLSGLLYNVRYEEYDDDVRLAERELVRHFRKIGKISEIPLLTKELKKFHTVSSFLQYYIGVYAEKFLNDNDLKRHASLIARRITVDVGTIDENIHLLGNVYENRTIHLEYLFDLVLPDDLLEKDVIEAKKYLVTKLNKFNVVEKYLRVQKYQMATPDQLVMEIAGQLRDIGFADSIATSLRMHARFWHRSRMIESLDELLELFDTYENLRQVPRYLRMMRKIDSIKKSLRHMRDVPVEILCNAPRACLRIGLHLVLRCKFITTDIKNLIKDFLELSDVCIEPVSSIQESRRSVEIPFMISKVRYSTIKQTTPFDTTSQRVTTEVTRKATEPPISDTEKVTPTPETSVEITTTPETTTEPMTPTPTIHHEETTTPVTSTTAATTPLVTTLLTTTTPLPTTTTPLPTTTTPLPTTTTPLPTTTTPLPTTTTALPTTTTALPTTTTMLPTTTSPATTMLTTITTPSPTTISTAVPTTTPTPTTTTLPTTIVTELFTTTTTPPETPSTELLTTTSPTVTVTETLTPDVVMKLKHSTFKIVYDHGVTKPLKNVTIFTTPVPPRSCEPNECKRITERVETTTPTMQTSTHEITEPTTSQPSTTDHNFISTPRVPPDTPRVPTDDCAKCLEKCKSKIESWEAWRRTCETSCDSDLEDCDGEDSPSLECTMENCECATKEDCMTLCNLTPPGSSLCVDGVCTSSEVPAVGIKLERKRTRQAMCEIQNLHHRRQKSRLAKMRANSAVAAAAAAAAAVAATAVETSRVDVLRPTSHHRDRIATKKLYNLLAARQSKETRTAGYQVKGPHGGKLRGNDRRHRRQRKQSHKRVTKKSSGKLIQGATIHRTREIIPSHHSQSKRISERGAKSIDV